MGEVMLSGVVPKMEVPRAGVLASDLAIGASVYLNESGVPVEYLVINQGIPSNSSYYDSSCNGTWLLRKDIYTKGAWRSSGYNNYDQSDVHSYLNSTFLNLFDSNTKSLIKTVKIPYNEGQGTAVHYGADGLSTQIFLLSVYELGFVSKNTGYIFVLDSAATSYFSGNVNSTRIAYMNGTATVWWTRSIEGYNDPYGFYVRADGDYGAGMIRNSYGYRPALILSSDALFDEDTMVLKEVS